MSRGAFPAPKKERKASTSSVFSAPRGSAKSVTRSSSFAAPIETDSEEEEEEEGSEEERDLSGIPFERVGWVSTRAPHNLVAEKVALQGPLNKDVIDPESSLRCDLVLVSCPLPFQFLQCLPPP